MMTCDLWTAQGPTAAELNVLDRLSRRRQAFDTPLTTKDEARIHALLHERKVRARERRNGDVHAATAFARPDIPPAASSAEPAVTAAETSPEDEVWNDLLDLTSEALETFIRFRNAVGVKRCLELLDLLAEAFGVDWPGPKEVNPAA